MTIDGPRTSRPSIAWIAALISVGFFGLYVSRLCPDVCLIGDSAELVTAAAVWGVPHPPGYPLFTALGHLFAAIPIHSSAWRVHLSSAVFHAATIAATLSATFTITRSRLASLASGIALGSARSFMLSSLYAEVFPLNDLLFACLMAIGLRVREGGGPERRRLLAFAVCAGVASAHHPMIALAMPALAILVLRPTVTYARANTYRWLELVVAFLVPVLLAYALVPLAAARSPYVSWGEVHDLRSLVRLVSRQDYGGLFSPARFTTREPASQRLSAFVLLVGHSVGLPVLVAAAIGVAERLRHAPAIGASLLLAMALPGPLFAWMNALDTGSEATLAYFERFTGMCHVPLAIAAGAAVAWAQSGLGTIRRGGVAAKLVMAAWSIWAVHRTADVDLSADRRGSAFAHDLVLATPSRALVLLAGDGPTGAAAYVCAVEKLCGDRIAFAPGLLSMPWRMGQTRSRYPQIEIPWSGGPALGRTHEIVAAEAPRRPVFVYPDLLEKDPELRRSFDVIPDHLLFRVLPPGSDGTGQHQELAADARAMIESGQEGCGIVSAVRPRPSQEVLLAMAYQAAFVNHLLAASRLAADAFPPGLVSSLEACASRTAAEADGQGAWWSTSR
jgi:hypothetical protein